jgi:type IX secretion system PorP/SprF family membrane protein
MKIKGIIISLLFVTISSFAQQDAQYTQYMYNTININPAYAGSRGAISIFGLHRTQWVGLEGAPVTNAASINAPIENTNLGIGLSVVNDKIGPTDQTSISTDVSYTIQTSDTYKLSFGIKATANLLNVDYTKLDRFNLADPQFQNNINNEFSPNIGAGLFYYSDKLYVGASIPNFIEVEHYNDTKSTAESTKMHYYLIGGYVFDLNRNLQFKPSFLSKIAAGAPLQIDVSANFLFNEKFVLGAAWRIDAAVSATAGFQISEGLFIGYGYDFDTTKFANYNSGSHEIFLRFEIFKSLDRKLTPRFF